jgi:hypothetical protein
MRQKGISCQEPPWYLSQPVGGDFANRDLYLSPNTIVVPCSVAWLWKVKGLFKVSDLLDQRIVFVCVFAGTYIERVGRRWEN